ncbi:ABC transporter permease [Subtercola endophyticus]|uniref:ABC transporter permease n=1 Tax=Subtercola endophyticus TaxID=2895559 RepID=UPI001E2E742B|nr:ABC transporter permease [Subtercola endophyticus]UFS59802.1 ABC transporter permease [Subtercola endophyticus]
MQILVIVLLSLGAGALVATMALSLLLTYRSSGVVNFAAGATAGFVAYTYWDLTTHGHLFIGVDIPIPGTPVAPIPALLICLLISALLGYAQYFLVYRPLRNAGPLAKVVASSGVLLVLEALAILAFGSTTLVVKPLLPSTTIPLGSVGIPLDRAIIVGIAIVLAIALSLVYRLTPFGIKTRAVADNRKGALLLGVNPGRLEALNWIIASTMTGAIGVLVSPLIGLSPTSLSLFIVPALSALLLAGLRSFGIAAAVGIAIGAAQALITFAQGATWFPKSNNAPVPGIKEALPFVIIAIVLFIRGRNLPDRLTERTRLPRAPRPNRLVLRFGIAIVLALGMITFAPFGWRQALITSLIGAIMCMSIVIVTGYLGQVTLAQTAIAGASGFMLSKLALALGWGFPLGAVVAILGAAAVSLIVALPALRMRGMQLAIVTLAGAVAIQSLWFLNPDWGGGTTAASVPPPSFLGIKLGSSDSFWNFGDSVPSPGFALLVLAITCLVALGVVTVRRSAFGARLLAVRSDEAAAAAAGVNVSRTKVLAFGIAGAVAGVAGVLYGYDFGLVTSGQYDQFTAIAFLAIAYLGGLTTVSGAVIGGLLVTQGVMMYTITTLFGIPSEFQLLIAGVAVITTVIGNPDGMAGFFRDRFARLGERLHRSKPQQAATVISERSESHA